MLSKALRFSWRDALRCLALFFVVFFTLPAFAITINTSGVSALTILQNIAATVPQLMQFVTALSYVIGMYFIIMGIVQLKHTGESRTMMSQEHSLTGPMMYLVSGALLLYLPTTVQVGMSTFWTDPNPYGYLQSQGQWDQVYNVCFTVVQFFGVVAFIRGVVMLSHIGGRGGQQGGLAKAFMHIIGGLFCINIYQFVQVVLVTLGIVIS